TFSISDDAPARIERIPERLKSSDVIADSRRGDQLVADAAHGAEIQGIGRIALDLAAQPVDLHVDGALAGINAGGGEGLARYGLTGARGEHAQHLAFAVGDAHRLAVARQLAAAEVKLELAEAGGLDGASGRL